MLNKPYLSIQEMVEKTQSQRKTVEELLDKGYFHPEEASILDNQKREDHELIKSALENIPLKEFLAKSGTTGIAGAAYLVADKIHTDLINYVQETDLAAQISAYMVNGWEGGALKVDLANNDSYVAHSFMSGGSLPTETVETKQLTLTPVSFGIKPRITNDLIEDAAFDMITWHMKQAAQAIGKKASSLALAVLTTCSDGWGTLNGGDSGDSGETKWTGATIDIEDCIIANSADEFLTNTVVTTPTAWSHSIYSTVPSNVWEPPKPGFQYRVNGIDVRLWTPETDLTSATSLLMTMVFDKANVLLTGRKRWMKIENYADPIRNLDTAVITCRQDSVTLYNDAAAKITETS